MRQQDSEQFQEFLDSQAKRVRRLVQRVTATERAETTARRRALADGFTTGENTLSVMKGPGKHRKMPVFKNDELEITRKGSTVHSDARGKSLSALDGDEPE